METNPSGSQASQATAFTYGLTVTDTLSGIYTN